MARGAGRTKEHMRETAVSAADGTRICLMGRDSSSKGLE